LHPATRRPFQMGRQYACPFNAAAASSAAWVLLWADFI